MLDSDLAELYEVETKVLKQAIKRNLGIFPVHFMFELTDGEFKNLRSQFVTSNWGGQRFVFTEHGILHLTNVLRSTRARKMRIRIIEIFIKMCEMIIIHQEILQRLEHLEAKEIEQDDKIMLIFEYLNQFEKLKQADLEFENRPKIKF